MRVGTKSVLFGVHCFFIHPIFVLRAWWIIYRSWPTLAEFCAILTHDLGYYGMPNMDGPEGETHPERVASWWRRGGSSFGNEVAAIVIGHSRFHAAKNGVPLSRLFRPDKLATALYPRWLYLIMANLSGEIHEYIGHCKDGKYANVHHMDKPSQIQWLIEIQAHMALMGLHGQNYGIVREQMAAEKELLAKKRYEALFGADAHAIKSQMVNTGYSHVVCQCEVCKASAEKEKSND